MRKIIVGLMIIAIGVLCLSFTSRISDGIFDTFFDDVSSVNRGNNNTNNSGDSSGGNGSTSGDGSSDNNSGLFSEEYNECYFQVCEPTEYICNVVIDTYVKPVKSGNYVYYQTKASRYYVKLSSVLAFTDSFYVSDGLTVYYEKTSVPVDETGSISTVIDLFKLDSYDKLYFGNISDTLNDSVGLNFSKYNQYSRGDYTYLWDECNYFSGYEVLFIKELNETINSATDKFDMPRYSHLYGLTINPGDRVVDGSVTGIVFK